MGVFEDLNAVSVNGHTEQKKSGSHKDEKTGKWVDTYLTYLSWPYAWAETKKRYPEAAYTVWKDQQGRPYAYDEQTGYMVYTSVTIDGITHEMWLPVMDGANKAMKSYPYTYSTKNGDKTVEAASMFDVNKTIMRCLVKNLAMFGLGLYIYAGEDLPEGMTDDAPKATQATPAVAEAALRLKVIKYANSHYNAEQIKQIAERYKVKGLERLSEDNCRDFIAALEKSGHSIDE